MNINPEELEKSRLAALKEFQILDTLPEQEYDDITLLASQICETPMAAVTLIDEKRQWFKSRVGLQIDQTPRDCAFCDHAIREDNLFVVEDASADARFAANPLVTGEPHIRFYAGAPLTTSDGDRIGTLCVIDKEPRQLSEAQKRALSALARSVMNLIETRNQAQTPDNSAKDSSAAFLKNEDESRTEKSFFSRYVKHYLLATAIILVFSAAKLGLDSVTGIEAPYLLFACAILLAAWRGGFGVGLYATLAATLIVHYLFLTSHGGFFSPGDNQYILFAIFIGQGVFISILCASRLRGEQLLRQARANLENRVANRTLQLAQANQELKQEIRERGVLQEDLRQARDAAVESARLKSEFLANMSHEIRTPMNGVIGMTGLLLDTKLDDEQKHFAEIIRSSGESLLTIINDILDFSKVEAGKLELETLDFNLRETFESLIELFSSRAREQNNELAAMIYSDVPLNLRGDAGRIRQILTNLIGNAIKFTTGGEIIVRIKKINETDERAELHFSVTDTGEGISSEAQKRLFQPFTQSDASTTRRFGGTGLGLSISKKLVEMMHGEIGLESEPGKGSTFWFTIALEKQALPPADDLPQASFAPGKNLVGPSRPSNLPDFDAATKEDFSENDIHITATPETKPIFRAGSRRILLVEDNSVNQMVAQKLLKKFGYRADVAANGQEALRALELIDYDLILMDCQMPVMDGYEATREIRARTWRAANVPIIALTALATRGQREKCLEAGMNDYLSKPIEKENLRQIVAHWLEKSDDQSAAGAAVVVVEASAVVEAASNVSAVDVSVLDEITDNDAVMRREVLEMYLAQTVTQLSEIERAITTNDADGLYKLAHKTVGGSTICGMRAIVEPLRRLEQLGREGKTEEAYPFYAQAQTAFAAIDRECREILER